MFDGPRKFYWKTPRSVSNYGNPSLSVNFLCISLCSFRNICFDPSSSPPSRRTRCPETRGDIYAYYIIPTFAVVSIKLAYSRAPYVTRNTVACIFSKLELLFICQVLRREESLIFESTSDEKSLERVDCSLFDHLILMWFLFQIRQMRFYSIFKIQNFSWFFFGLFVT